MHQGVSGSNVLMTDASGAITDSHTFDAFGNPLTSSGSSPTRFLFGGGFGWETDSDSHLIAKGDLFRDTFLYAYRSGYSDGQSAGSNPVTGTYTTSKPMVCGLDGEGAASVPNGPIMIAGRGHDPLDYSPHSWSLSSGVSRHISNFDSGWDMWWWLVMLTTTANPLDDAAIGVGEIGIDAEVKAGAVALDEGAARGGAQCVYKGQRGVDRLVEALKAAGHDVRGKEVTFVTDAGRFRADVVSFKDGELYIWENKSGLGKVTGNQRRNFEACERSGATGVGRNAKKALASGYHKARRVHITHY